jgi:hypothetical protein
MRNHRPGETIRKFQKQAAQRTANQGRLWVGKREPALVGCKRLNFVEDE